jgi:hypothetical protein
VETALQLLHGVEEEEEEEQQQQQQQQQVVVQNTESPADAAAAAPAAAASQLLRAEAGPPAVRKSLCDAFDDLDNIFLHTDDEFFEALLN